MINGLRLTYQNVWIDVPREYTVNDWIKRVYVVVVVSDMESHIATGTPPRDRRDAISVLQLRASTFQVRLNQLTI